MTDPRGISDWSDRRAPAPSPAAAAGPRKNRLLDRFRRSGTWEPDRLEPDAVRGTWSQAVFGVADTPRYEAIGRRVHEHGISTWESRETARPLPRRQYTEREDYDVLVGVNRHYRRTRRLDARAGQYEARRDLWAQPCGRSPHAVARVALRDAAPPAARGRGAGNVRATPHGFIPGMLLAILRERTSGSPVTRGP